jgi:hypothetical protein
MSVRSLRRSGFVAVLLAALGAAGCATVRPYEKEHLSDPVMSFRADAREAADELHWMEAREGSTGGAGAAAGGCACN